MSKKVQQDKKSWEVDRTNPKWEQNFKNVFYMLKNWKFWGRNQHKFLISIPQEVFEIIESDVRHIFDTLEVGEYELVKKQNRKIFSPKTRYLTIRKYILLHLLNSLEISEVEKNDTITYIRKNKVDHMERFLREKSKLLTVELGYKKKK